MVEAADGGAGGPDGAFRVLPGVVDLDQTVVEVDPDPAPDPAAGRNLDQHRALRDD